MKKMGAFAPIFCIIDFWRFSAVLGGMCVKKYSQIAAKKPQIFLLIILLMNLFALFGILRLHINTDVEALWGGESKYEAILKKMEEEFSSGDQIGVLVKFEGEISPKVLNELLALQKRLEGVEGVLKVIGVPESVFKGFRVVKISKVDESNFEDVLSMLRSSPIKRFGDGFFFLTVVLKKDANIPETLKALKMELKGVDCSLSGNAFIEQEIFGYVLMIIFTFIPIIVLVMISVFAVKLGSFKSALFSLAPAGMAAAWSLGLMGWVSKDLSILTVLVPIFVIVFGSADGLHFMSHYLETEGGPKGVEKTLKIVGIAMIMTTLTTMAGFLSFVFLPAVGLRQLGFYSAIGLGFAAISTWLFLPAIVPFRSFKKIASSERSSLLFSKKYWVWVVVLIVAAMAPGIFMLKKHFSVISFYRSWTAVRKSFEEVKEKTGFALPVFAVGEMKDPLSQESAERILSLERNLESSGAVEYAFSIYDLLEKMGEKLYGQKGYPKAAKLVYLLLRRADPSSVDMLMKGRSFRMMMSVDEDADLESLERTLKGEHLTVSGVPYILRELNERIVPAQVESIILAMAIVFSMLLLMTRSFRTSLVSIVPISLTLIVLFGFMGYAHIPLNITTTIMAAITIGVGIDYAIHYTALHREFGRQEALRGVSTPILANAFGLAIGYTPMFFSPLQIHLYLAMIMWVTMVSSATFSLVLLPRLLRDNR